MVIHCPLGCSLIFRGIFFVLEDFLFYSGFFRLSCVNFDLQGRAGGSFSFDWSELFSLFSSGNAKIGRFRFVLSNAVEIKLDQRLNYSSPAAIHFARLCHFFSWALKRMNGCLGNFLCRFYQSPETSLTLTTCVLFNHHQDQGCKKWLSFHR